MQGNAAEVHHTVAHCAPQHGKSRGDNNTLGPLRKGSRLGREIAPQQRVDLLEHQRARRYGTQGVAYAPGRVVGRQAPTVEIDHDGLTVHRRFPAEVRLRVSDDNGFTWDEPRTLFPATPGDSGVFVRQPPVVLPTGRLLLPVFRCRTVPGEKWSGDLDTSAVMISDDQGTTWREQPVPGSTGLVHMNVHRLPDGSLLALYRSRRADAVHRSVSLDDGDTWSEPEPLDVPNNNSSIQYIVLADGRLALTYNHSSAADATARRVSLCDEIDDTGGLADDKARTGGATTTAVRRETAPSTAFWGAPRAPLSLALSSDGGRTWPLRADLVTGDGHCLTNNSRDGLNRELSYPSIAQTPDGAVHIAYTHHRKVIRHIRLVLR